jgi:hypothetical protein
MKESYLQDGYEITEEDIKKFSFTAKKQLN